MSKQPNPWTFRLPEEWKPEIAASTEKRGLKRHAWLRWAIRKVLDAEKASTVDYQPNGTAQPIKFVGESGLRPLRLAAAVQHHHRPAR